MLWLGTHALDIGAITPLFYYLPRPGRDSQDFREVLRRAADHARLPHRRLPYETYDGFEQSARTSVDFVDAQDRRVRRTAHHQPHLGRAHQGRGHDLRRGVHRPGRDRSGAARQRREVGPAQSPALRRLREFRFRNSRPAERRHLRPVHGAHGGDAAIAAHHRAGGRKDSRRARSWPRCRR